MTDAPRSKSELKRRQILGDPSVSGISEDGRMSEHYCQCAVAEPDEQSECNKCGCPVRRGASVPGEPRPEIPEWPELFASMTPQQIAGHAMARGFSDEAQRVVDHLAARLVRAGAQQDTTAPVEPRPDREPALRALLQSALGAVKVVATIAEMPPLHGNAAYWAKLETTIEAALLAGASAPPTSADEPPWPNWFSCPECYGWFEGEGNAYESGDVLCDACAKERDAEAAARPAPTPPNIPTGTIDADAIIGRASAPVEPSPLQTPDGRWATHDGLPPVEPEGQV